jgi:hypothetical protein
MELVELALLAIGSAFWPALIAVDLVAFRTRRPASVLAWFLAGGLLTTIAEGLVIVFVLEGTTLGSRGSVGAWGNLVFGIAALLAAALLKARAARSGAASPRDRNANESWTRAVENGGRYAFAAGVVLNVFPGILPLVALRLIASLSYGNAAKVLLISGLYLCTFALVEAPLAGLLLAPQRVEPRLRALDRWLDRNGTRLAIDVLVLVGLLLVVRGIGQLAIA